jgi:hypothetical protein
MLNSLDTLKSLDASAILEGEHIFIPPKVKAQVVALPVLVVA